MIDHLIIKFKGKHCSLLVLWRKCICLLSQLYCSQYLIFFSFDVWNFRQVAFRVHSSSFHFSFVSYSAQWVSSSDVSSSGKSLSCLLFHFIFICIYGVCDGSHLSVRAAAYSRALCPFVESSERSLDVIFQLTNVFLGMLNSAVWPTGCYYSLLQMSHRLGSQNSLSCHTSQTVLLVTLKFI